MAALHETPEGLRYGTEQLLAGTVTVVFVFATHTKIRYQLDPLESSIFNRAHSP